MSEKRKTALTLKFDKTAARKIELWATRRGIAIDDESTPEMLATLLENLVDEKLEQLKSTPTQLIDSGKGVVNVQGA